MSEEIKKTEQTELSEQELDNVAGGRITISPARTRPTSRN